MAQSAQYCVNHPKQATRVSCAACGSPICTDCMRETPVGMKCPACARMPLHARALGKPRHYVMAVGAGLGTATALGAFIALAHIPFFGLILPVIAGAVVGLAVTRGAHGNRHGAFMGIAAASTVVGLILGGMLAGGLAGGRGPGLIGPSLLGLILAAMVAAFVVSR